MSVSEYERKEFRDIDETGEIHDFCVKITVVENAGEAGG